MHLLMRAKGFLRPPLLRPKKKKTKRKKTKAQGQVVSWKTKVTLSASRRKLHVESLFILKHDKYGEANNPVSFVAMLCSLLYNCIYAWSEISLGIICSFNFVAGWIARGVGCFFLR